MVENYATTVENKTTNAATWQQKKHCWERIADEFCSQSPSNRTALSLKEKYENMKKQTKSILQATKKETFVVGGCGYPIEMSSTDERIAALMGTSAYDFDNGFDSDASNKSILNLELFT